MEPRQIVILRFAVAVAVTALLLFSPARTVSWWQAWVYLALFFIPMALIARYLAKYDPELLKRRLQTKEEKPKQGLLAYLFYTSIGLEFVIAGFDHRYGWSGVPQALALVSAIIFLLGYYFLFRVFKENKYLAHTVRVEEGQKVISTGPYAVVRHHMYLAELIMFVFTPLALGSFWALAPIVIFFVILVARIITEENVLMQELEGYGDYTGKTRFRFIPGVW